MLTLGVGFKKTVRCFVLEKLTIIVAITNHQMYNELTKKQRGKKHGKHT